VRLGVAAGLHVNAGHGLHYHNVGDIAGIPAVQELNIGHAIIARALFCGLADAVVEMKRLMREARAVAQ
jgi:pyridoxine 5-phosphate synthase